MTEPQPQQPPAQQGYQGAPSPEPRKGGFWRFVWRHPALSSLVLLLLLVGIFLGQNWEPTTIDFLFWEAITVPKIMLLALGVPLGALGWELVRRALR